MKPATFLERGVAVPFTTPILARSRGRPIKRNQAELIIPNPSGGDGQYIIPMTSVNDFCTPSLHDQYILDKLPTLGAITPATMRYLANTAALKGLAGRVAAKAARTAGSEFENMMLLNYLILFANILHKAGHANADWRKLNIEDPATRAKAKLYLNQIAPTLGITTDQLLAELEMISQAVAFVGFKNADFSSPAGRQLDDLEALVLELRHWSDGDDDLTALAQLIANTASATLERGRHFIAQCHRVSEDVNALFKAWFRHPDKLKDMFAKPDWLFDGWPQICQLWQSAAGLDQYGQQQIVMRIAKLVPLMPAEVDKWFGASQGTLLQKEFDRVRVRLNEDWMTGQDLASFTSSETMQALYFAPLR